VRENTASIKRLVVSEVIDTPTVKTTNSLAGINVSWNKIEGAVKYVVYKRLGTESTWEIVGTTENTTIEDTSTLKAGNYYVYSVRAYSFYGVLSNYDKTKTTTVQRVIAPYTKAANALDGMSVTWGKVAGANKYVVLRRIGTESTWTTICTTTGTSYLDKNVKPGIYYIYSIRAVNNTGYSAYDVNKRITLKRVIPSASDTSLYNAAINEENQRHNAEIARINSEYEWDIEDCEFWIQHYRDMSGYMSSSVCYSYASSISSEIEAKERKLAFMKMDSSGAYYNEIRALEAELEADYEEYDYWYIRYKAAYEAELYQSKLNSLKSQKSLEINEEDSRHEQAIADIKAAYGK
jgi:hypothetical protein